MITVTIWCFSHVSVNVFRLCICLYGECCLLEQRCTSACCAFLSLNHASSFNVSTKWFHNSVGKALPQIGKRGGKVQKEIPLGV